MYKLLLLSTAVLMISLVRVSAGEVVELAINSKKMDRDIPCLVITPDNYKENSDRYPVVYLLHGAGGDYNTWIKVQPKIKELVDLYNIIVVCPDGGRTSWYFDSPIDKSMQYETFVTDELIKHIDSNYRTKADRNGRAITGLSMGGHGALYLSFRHLDLFSVAGSTSGGVDIRPWPLSWDIAKRLGKESENPELWSSSSVINNIYRLTPNSIKLIIDCGTKDFFSGVNNNLHEKLLERNIPHDYIVRPGAHTGKYWSNSILHQLLFFNNHFESTSTLK